MPVLRIAHFSDPHIGPLPAVKLRQLASKRLTGYVNYRRTRVSTHDMTVLAGLLADMGAQAPDHVCCTGDVANIGLVAEFAAGAELLATLGPRERVTFVPGNHDIYVRGSIAPLIRHLGPWMVDDGTGGTRFPFVRRIGRVALIGLSSAVPTLPFMASGTLGRSQRQGAEAVLAALGAEGAIRVVLIHHPPHRGGARPGRGLTDAAGFEAMIARTGADLVLHGHNHVSSLAWRSGLGRPVPILGAPSASAAGGTASHRAGYHLIAIDTQSGAIEVSTRGPLPDGSHGEIDRMTLAPVS